MRVIAITWGSLLAINPTVHYVAATFTYLLVKRSGVSFFKRAGQFAGLTEKLVLAIYALNEALAGRCSSGYDGYVGSSDFAFYSQGCAKRKCGASPCQTQMFGSYEDADVAELVSGLIR
ncbi:hypothetical protein Tco_0437872 [Tanacetum coccineum]